MSNKLHLEVGQNEEGMDFLLLELEIPGRSVPVWESKHSLNNCSGDDFLDMLAEGLNEATLWVRAFNLHVVIDAETILELSEDFSAKTNRITQQLLKETKS